MIENHKELFSKFYLDSEEQKFIEDTINSYKLADRAVMVHGAVSSFFLSKQIEKSIDMLNESNFKLAAATNRQSCIMIWLTIAIAAMTLVMMALGIYQLLP